MGEVCLAVDIGGTKICAGLVDHRGEVLTQERMPTPTDGDPESLMGCLAGLIRTLFRGRAREATRPAFSGRAREATRPAFSGRAREATRPAFSGRAREATRPVVSEVVVCGVGCGGPMSLGGVRVSPLNIPAWREFPLRRRLEEETGLPVFIDNDAKALALGEWWQGGARGLSSFLAMVVSTGVGGGVVVDGRLLDGATGNAGHIGHLIVEPDGHLCGCGARGCLEAEASGTAIAAITGRDPASAGPEVIERTGRMVGRAVASVVNLLDIPLALVAGSVALGFGGPFFEAAQKEIDLLARTDFARGARIAPAVLGESGPLVGAAAVGWRGRGLSGPWS